MTAPKVSEAAKALHRDIDSTTCDCYQGGQECETCQIIETALAAARAEGREEIEEFRKSWQESSMKAQRERYEMLLRAEAAEARLKDAFWTCPSCAFSFSKEHEDEGGGYSCPLCALKAAEAALAELRPVFHELRKDYDLACAGMAKQTLRVSALEAELQKHAIYRHDRNRHGTLRPFEECPYGICVEARAMLSHSKEGQ